MAIYRGVPDRAGSGNSCRTPASRCSAWCPASWAWRVRAAACTAWTGRGSALQFHRRVLQPGRHALPDAAGRLPPGHRILRRHGDRRRLHHRHGGAAVRPFHLQHARSRDGYRPPRRGRQSIGQAGKSSSTGLRSGFRQGCSTAITTTSITATRRPAGRASRCAATAMRWRRLGGRLLPHGRAVRRHDEPRRHQGGLRRDRAGPEPGAGRPGVAAVAVPPPGGGPSRLVVYLVTPPDDPRPASAFSPSCNRRSERI